MENLVDACNSEKNGWYEIRVAMINTNWKNFEPMLQKGNFVFSKTQKIKWLIRCSVMECMLLSHTAGQYKSTFEAWSVLIVCSLQNKKAAHVLWQGFMQNSEQKSSIGPNWPNQKLVVLEMYILAQVQWSLIYDQSLNWWIRPNVGKTRLKDQLLPKFTSQIMAWLKVRDNIGYQLLKVL